MTHGYFIQIVSRDLLICYTGEVFATKKGFTVRRGPHELWLLGQEEDDAALFTTSQQSEQQAKSNALIFLRMPTLTH